jgi:YggT family protein
LIELTINLFLHLILILFLIDLTGSDTYNKVSRMIKFLLFPILLIFNIYYKKVNIGLFFASVLLFSGYLYYLSPELGILSIANLSIFKVSITLIGILKFTIIAGVILSWLYMFGVDASNSLSALIQQLYESTVSIFRNIIPPTAGFDLSPLIAFFVLQLAERGLTILAGEIIPRVLANDIGI